MPDESSPGSVWLIKVKDSFESAVEMIDDCKNVITPGVRYIKSRFKTLCFSQRFLYKLRKKKTLFLKESVVHPFVQFKGQKNGFFLYEEYFEVLNYVDSNELSRI